MSERVRNPQIQKRSSVLWSQKRPMSLQGVRVRGDAKFLLSQRLRSSSQLNGERCETSHQSFSFWFKKHRDVSNGAITPRSVLLGLFSRCLSALETVHALCRICRCWRQRSGALCCADSIPACSPGMSEVTQRTVNQRHTAACVTAIPPTGSFICSFWIFYRFIWVALDLAKPAI